LLFCCCFLLFCFFFSFFFTYALHTPCQKLLGW
jgi:hypothetical protein